MRIAVLSIYETTSFMRVNPTHFSAYLCNSLHYLLYGEKINQNFGKSKNYLSFKIPFNKTLREKL